MKRTEEFRADAVRIALTSGLARKQEVSDLGVGLGIRHGRLAILALSSQHAAGREQKNRLACPFGFSGQPLAYQL